MIFDVLYMLSQWLSFANCLSNFLPTYMKSVTLYRICRYLTIAIFTKWFTRTEIAYEVRPMPYNIASCDLKNLLCCIMLVFDV